MTTLTGMNVAILAADGFELAELVEPRKALDQAGATTLIVSPAKGEVQGWKHFDKADRFKVDVPLADADPSDFDALLLDWNVPDVSGIEVLSRVRRQLRSAVPVLLITGRTSEPGFVNDAQIRELDRAGMDVGDHTVHHVDLTQLTAPELIARTILSDSDALGGNPHQLPI